MAVHFIYCEGWSREKWLGYRDDGLGASDVPTVMNLNPYMSSLELHHIKIGLAKPRPMNLRMNLGHMSEPLIGELWSYWVKDERQFNHNVTNRIKVRECEKVNGYMTNDDFKNLFVSLDYRFKDKRFDGWCNLELKNKTSLSYKQFTESMNPMEVVQMACQMLVSTYEYSEIAYFIDNAQLEVLPMTYKDALALKPSITKAVKSFWSNVEKARICLNKIENAKQNYNMKLVADLEMELLSYEPESSGNAYLEYLTQIAKDKKSEIGLKATDEHIVLVNKLAVLSKKRKKIEDEEVGIKSKILHDLRMADKNELDLGRLGKVGIWNNRFKISLK